MNYIYIMASASGVLYIGVTSELESRVRQHRKGAVAGFSQTYKCTKLVYYEEFQYVNDALAREKQLKKWRREKKEALIKQGNAEWLDLAADWS
jgi:putative endonuclease